MDIQKCPSLEEWERYLLDDRMENRPALEQHLKDCAYCHFILERCRQQLAQLERTWSASGSKSVIRLLPIEVEAFTDDRVARILAAQGEEETTQTASVTLASKDRSIVLRAVQDVQSKDIWLYLMAADPASCRGILVRPFATGAEYLTDDNGRVNLGRVDWPKEEMLTADAVFPVATFTLSPFRVDIDDVASTVLDGPSGDQIRVTYSGKGRNRRLEVKVLKLADPQKETPVRVAVRRPGDEGFVSIETAESDLAYFDDIDVQGTLEIYLYQ